MAFIGMMYCQIIGENKKAKRLKFTVRYQNKETFDNVIFPAETKIEIECHTKRQCRKNGQALYRHIWPIPKHLLKATF